MTGSFQRRQWFGVCLLAIVLAALGLRLYRLDAESLYMDEIVTVETFPRSPSGLIESSAMVGQPPLESFIGKAVFWLGLGHSDWWVRFPAAIFGTGAVLLLGVWVRALAGDLTGLTAALLLAVCPLHVYMSQEARPYALLFFLALACGLSYVRARERLTAASWIAFASVTFAMLMTRWTDPHFVVLGIALHAVAKVQMSKSPKVQFHEWKTPAQSIGKQDTNGGLERMLFRRTAVSLTAAYACYAPFFLIVLSYQKSAIRAPTGDWAGRFSSLLSEAFAALFAGYSTRTVFTALPGSRWLVAIAAVLTIAGLILGLLRFKRTETSSSTFWWIFIPFPFVYALVYALLGDAVPKPQYLLIMAIPAIACIAIALTHLGRILPRRTGALAVAASVALVAVPMSQNSWACLERIDKRDWRGAMGFLLKKHASAGDVAVSLGSDMVTPTFRPKAYGKDRYGPPHLKFIPVSTDTTLEAFSDAHWQSRENTVWMLVYTDRMYTGADYVVPPNPSPDIGSIRSFNGLFLVELAPGKPGIERLMDTIGKWYEVLPSEASISAPALLRWRYAKSRGDALIASDSLAAARRQCASNEDLAALEEIVQSANSLAQSGP